MHTKSTTGSAAITPFTVNIPQSALDDLKRRLDMTRWPNRQRVSDWSQGVPLSTAPDNCDALSVTLQTADRLRILGQTA